MKEEMNSLQKNKTWKLVNLPEGRKVIKNKWSTSSTERERERRKYELDW